MSTAAHPTTPSAPDAAPPPRGAPAAATHATATAAHAWHRAFRDLPRQHGFERLAVEGRLPEGLRGTLYRNGPSLFSSFGRRYAHWFDGDGAVSAVRFDAGGASGSRASPADACISAPSPRNPSTASAARSASRLAKWR